MVKVLKCFSFQSSHILENVTVEPVSLACGKNFVFAGTNDCSVLVFKKCVDGQSWEQYCSFKTGAEVTNVEYNLTGDYVATIERKMSRSSMVVSVKVYLNWHIAHTQESYRTRVRIAGLGYKSNIVHAHPDERLEVIDISSERQASFITTCQETGNIGIVFDNLVRLYHLVEKTIPNSHTTFLDVIPFLEVNFEQLISRISLCEEYLACCSPQYVQVYQIDISHNYDFVTLETPDSSTGTPEIVKRRPSTAASSLNLRGKLDLQKGDASKLKPTSQRETTLFSAIGDRSSSTPSPSLVLPNQQPTETVIEDDVHFVQWSFDTDHNHDSPLTPGEGVRRSDNNKTICLKGLKKLGQESRPEPTQPSVKDLRGGNHSTTGRTLVEQVLCQYLGRGDTRWIHVHFVPSYSVRRGTSLQISMNSSGVPVHSSRRHNLVGVACVMSGPSIGYTFSLMPRPKLLSTYSYSEEAHQIVANGLLMYVMLNEKLEIYTSRCHIAAAHNVEQFDNVTKTCPSPTIDVCMCGVQQFFGPRLMAADEQHVVLFNKMSGPQKARSKLWDGSWNVNVMAQPPVRGIYQDMVRFGRKYQEKSPHTYEHLLLEGHMMLKSSLIGQLTNQLEVSKVADMLRESAGLLGQCYALPATSQWSLCLPYMSMSELSIVDAVQQVSDLRSLVKSPGYGQGMVLYLKHVLFTEDDPLDIDTEAGDTILQVCHEAMPDKLADVLLFSRLKNVTPQLGVQLLQNQTRGRRTVDKRASTNECLAMVALDLQLCELDHAKALLATIDKADLVETCVENHPILHTGLREFTPLSQLLRCDCPELLIDILVRLYEKGTLPMDLSLTLLQGKAGLPDIHKNKHVMTYLEALVSDESRRFSFEDAVSQLCDIYIARISEWSPPSIRQITPALRFKLPRGGHFSRRHGWLDEIPPFTGSRSITSTCKFVLPMSDRGRAGIKSQQWLKVQRSEATSCGCFLCNEDLLKLQSLMCYNELSPAVCDQVLSSIDRHQGDMFVSVKLLAMLHTDITEAIELVCGGHPTISAEFAASVFAYNKEKWEILLRQLMVSMESKSTDADSSSTTKEVYTQAVKDVLKEMAHILTPEDFVGVLPGDGNFFFFLPYVRMCMEHQQSLTLKERFCELGEQLLANQ